MPLLVAIAMLGTACDPYVRTTVVELRDPSDVHYATSLGRPIDPNRKPAVISDDDLRYQGNHISELIVTAQPAPDGTLKTAWQTDPDVFHEQRGVTFRPASTTVIDGHDAVTMSPDTLSFPVCGTHQDSGVHRKGGTEHFGLALGPPYCNSRRTDFQINAVTPMSNVESVRNVYEADRGRTVMTALVVTMLAGGVASVLWLSPPGKSAQAAADAKTGAGVVLAIGGAIDVGLVLSAIFARDHEEVIYQGPREVQRSP